MHKLHQLIQEGQPIFVRNMSGTSPDGITKLIMLQIKPINGPERSIRIPPIRFPINLSAMVSPPYILGESQDFLELLNKEVLELVDPAKAMEELADPKVARIVQKALRDMYNRNIVPDARKKARADAGATGERRKVPHLDIEEDESGSNNPMAKMMKAAAEGLDYEQGDIRFSDADQEVSPRIVQMCATLNAEPAMAEDILDDLEAMPEADLSEEDLGHLIRHAKASKVVEWAQSQLADRAGDDEDIEVEVRPSGHSQGKKRHRRR